MSLKERTAALDAAYPFGERSRFPYKVWLRERKRYLAQYGARKPAAKELTPIEQLMERAS